MLINSRTNSPSPAFGASYGKVCRVYSKQGEDGVGKMLIKELRLGNFKEAHMTFYNMKIKGAKLIKSGKSEKGNEVLEYSKRLLLKFSESCYKYVQIRENEPLSKNFTNFFKNIKVSPEAFKERVLGTKK